MDCVHQQRQRDAYLLIAPDGTGCAVCTMTRTMEHWPDGRRTGRRSISPAPGLDGWTLYAIDLATGAVKTLFVLEDASIKAPTATVSPDGPGWLIAIEL